MCADVAMGIDGMEPRGKLTSQPSGSLYLSAMLSQAPALMQAMQVIGFAEATVRPKARARAESFIVVWAGLVWFWVGVEKLSSLRVDGLESNAAGRRRFV